MLADEVKQNNYELVEATMTPLALTRNRTTEQRGY